MKKIIYLVLLVCTSFLRAEIAEQPCQALILGSGVGALTSAVYLCRAGITPIVITGDCIGGTITQSHNVQNWPGEPSISGIELSEKVQKQAELNGAILVPEIVVSVDLSKRPFTVTTKKILGSNETLKIYRPQTIIIALGSSPNLLHIPGEQEYWSRGVYNCAVCDGSHYRDQVVTIVGGGDSALLDAEYLSQIAKQVHILVRKDAFRSLEKQRLRQVLALPNVEVHYQTIVKEIYGDGKQVTDLLVESSGNFSKLKTDALFLAIGSTPNTTLFQNQMQLDSNGYILLKKHQQTSIPGVFAIGDVSDPEFKQAISAAGDAAKAAIEAQRFLAAQSSTQAKEVFAAEVKPLKKQVISIESKKQFENILQSATGPIFVDFYSTLCGPCRTFSPQYEQWAKQFGDKILFLKVNSDHNQDLFKKYQVRAVPTLLVLDPKGNILQTNVGLYEISKLDEKLSRMRDRENITYQDFAR